MNKFLTIILAAMSIACATTKPPVTQQSTAQISTEYSGPAKCELTPQQKENVARDVAEYHAKCLQLVDDPLNNNCSEVAAHYERTAIEVYTARGCR